MPDPAAKPALAGTQPLEFTVRRFAEIDSTNRWLLDEARAGACEGLVAVADHQSAGRGRKSRTWVAPPGASLLVSLLLRPTLAPVDAHLVTMACGLAAVAAVRDVAGFEPSLKWPNDLVVDDRKMAGVLAEAILSAGRLDAVVVGMGLNVNWNRFPPDLAATATACNLEAGRPVDRDALLASWLDHVAALGGTDVPTLLGRYRGHCSTIGRTVRVELAGGAFTGDAVDVDDGGRLLVDGPGGERRAIAVGDVVHVRPEPAPAG